MPVQKSPETAGKPEILTTGQMFSLTGEIGYMIAIPAAVFVYIGAKVDHLWGTSPFLTIAGLALAIAVSTFAVWRRIRPFLP